MLKKITLTILLLLCSTLAVFSADLPSKGKTPPPVVQGPGSGGPPDAPDTPIGCGLAVLLSFSAVYFMHKKRNAKD